MSVAEMAQAAISLLDRLGNEHDAVVSLPFPHDEERRLWFYTPTDHGGLRLGEMSPVAQQACMRLLAAGLSDAGYLTAVWVMALENILDRLEGWSSRGDRRSRDPLGYSVTVFGEPGSDAWGWRFGGHHLSVNVTIVEGEVASTPCFFGADPASSPGPGGVPFRPLGAAEDHGRALVAMLSPEQREVAVLAPVPPHDIVMGNRSAVVEGALPLNLWEIFRDRSPLPVDEMRARQEAESTELGLRDGHLEAVRITEEPRGLSGRDMTDGQVAALETVVLQFQGRLRMPGPVEPEALCFAWAGGLEPGAPHYYRVQGPRLLIEYDNALRGANHAHSVCRDPDGDFGADLLGRHYSEHHGMQ